ncbi:Sas10/Utp3/C1D family-domain-containing protein [Dendryphion nanum]|uniref:Sas10/Utp3/C1D family-domain-containing protein n=1 Tax=Dendryphion nanum TaxID=256645 RepID=A0A9P9ID68_9PLEO|nr:Sas10/Utp3/C1D family-domain-containing protein [Dendryphion nanum]
MAIDNSLTSLLATLTSSLKSATEVVPADGTAPPNDGISLLDLKNDLLLSYLQNLVFLILLKIRNQTSQGSSDKNIELQDEIVTKLVGLRVYLEKGVRPLETRLKYQIDNIIRAADDSARRTAQAEQNSKSNGVDGEDNSDDSDAGSNEGADSDEEKVGGANLAQFVREKADGDKRATNSSKDGIYRPPRITPMAMPTTQGREEKASKRMQKSATMDEYVASELSTAPLAEPSIGSTIMSGGRRTKSDKERREELERRDYEESNFTRLPKENKKDKSKRNQGRDGGWGGEEWRGLGAGLDRIERLTQKKSGSLGSLERSRKRPVQDGPRGTGAEAGDAFEKRRKVVSRYRK